MEKKKTKGTDMDISKFKYTIGLNAMITEERINAAKFNREDIKDKQSAGQKISRMRAINRIAGYIVELLRSDDKDDNELGKLLKLEREYIRRKEKDDLMIEIERVTGDFVGGAYTLAEIGEVLGLTRERVRQLESSGLKLMKHPNVLRALKEMTYK
jgi:hypothetical protein